MKSVTKLLCCLLCLVACVNIAVAQDQDTGKTWEDILNEDQQNTPSNTDRDNSFDFDQIGKDLENGLKELENVFGDLGFKNGDIIIQGDTVKVMSEIQKAWNDLDVDELVNMSKDELEQSMDELKDMMEDLPDMLDQVGDQLKDLENIWGRDDTSKK